MAALQLSWTRVRDKWGSGPSASSPKGEEGRQGACMEAAGGSSKAEGRRQWEEPRNPAPSL